MKNIAKDSNTLPTTPTTNTVLLLPTLDNSSNRYPFSFICITNITTDKVQLSEVPDLDASYIHIGHYFRMRSVVDK